MDINSFKKNYKISSSSSIFSSCCKKQEASSWEIRWVHACNHCADLKPLTPRLHCSHFSNLCDSASSSLCDKGSNPAASLHTGHYSVHFSQYTFSPSTSQLLLPKGAFPQSVISRFLCLSGCWFDSRSLQYTIHRSLLQGSPIHSKFLCAGIFSSILRLQTFFTPAPFFYPLMLPVGLTFYITLPLAWRKLWLTSLHCCLLKILCWFAPLKCRLYLLRRCKDHSRTKVSRDKHT